jgi:drug/metabolite transporter (DMT)-like permease
MNAATSSNQWRGYLFVVLAAVLWGISGTAAKYLFHQGIDALQLVQLSVTLASAFLLVWLVVRDRRLFHIDRQDLLYFAILGAGAMAAVQFTYLYAISKIQVAAAILLQYLGPGFIAIYAVVVQGDRLKAPTLVALISAFTGCYLVVGAYNLDVLQMNLAGVISGILSAVAFAWYSLQAEYVMRRYSPWTVLFYALFFAAVAWNVFHPPLAGFVQARPFSVWCWIAYIAVMGTVAPFGFYLEGVSRIRSTRASITATLEPISAGIFAFVFLAEYMAPLQILGGFLVIGAVILLQLKQEHDNMAPAHLRALRQSPTIRKGQRRQGRT